MAADANTRTTSLMQFLPILLCFFAMGFVDLVGIASNYVQKDLALPDSQANMFPSLVFFWFLIFSVPVSMLMNRIGRRRTVLVSLVITFVSLLIPLFGNSFGVMLVAFSLLGIGNAFMQTSLNPLVSNIVNPKKLPSALTFGQFIKAIASFMAPILAMWGATAVIPSFGLGWRALFLIYACVSLLAMLWLGATPIAEERADKVSGFRECLALLGKGLVFLSFIGIICHVGIDVGTNTTAPRILMERCGLALEEAGIATSVYFIFRTLGCLVGAGALQKIAAKIFFLISAAMLALGLFGLFFVDGRIAIYICIGLIGFGNSNIFSIILAQTLLRLPDEANEVSGLMIMGLFGGTLFPLAMGFASDMMASQTGAILVMAAGALYLLCYTAVIRSQNV